MRILLVDDHKLIRDAITAYFEDDPMYEVVAEANNGIEGLEKIEETNPEVVLSDIKMPEMDGIEFTQEIKKRGLGTRVIIISMFDDYKSIKNAMNAGADGYLFKNCGEDEIKKAISTVMNGETYYNEEITKIVMEGLTGRTKSSPRVVKEMPLSEREKEVLKLIIKEYSNQETADELFISVRTVDAHKRNILDKTGAKNVAGLVFYALENKLFDDL